MINSLSRRHTPLGWFLVPFLLQLVIILAVPSKSFYTYQTGETVTIQTRPVDPYDFLRGYSQTLSYGISSVRDLPEPKDGKLNRGDTFYLVLEAPKDRQSQPPLPWTPVATYRNFPNELNDNQIVLRGTLERRNWAIYGLERYYFPESQRDRINQEIRDLRSRRNDSESFVVEIKIDRFGNSVPYSLWVGENNYRF